MILTRLRSFRWAFAWMIWLVLLFMYFNYRAVEVVNTTDISDIMNMENVETVNDMQLVSLPVPPPAPLSPAPSPQAFQPKVESQNEQSRLWLAKLEEGEGPNIVLTWPEDATERDWIRQRLYRCGVRLGKWRNGRLRAIEVGAETVSGFIRVLSGEVSQSEQRRLQTLVGEGQIVRLFPRRLDLFLLSQLSNVTSGKFMGARHVRADYVKHLNGVNLHNIQVDGKKIERNAMFLPENGQCS